MNRLSRYLGQDATSHMPGIAGLVFAVFAFGLSVFLFLAASISPMAAFQHRTIFVTGTLALVFLSYPLTGRRGAGRLAPWDAALAVLAIAAGAYLFSRLDGIALAGGVYVPTDYLASAILLALILEATRRTVGLGLVLLALAFILYALNGRSLPGVLRHFGFSIERVVMHLTLTTEGVLGMITGIAATYVFLFVLFGAVLTRAGMMDFFNDMSIGIAGRRVGGPAKVAVLGSAVMGMINGSAASNVATTGNFSIPLMKRIGYKPAFAGAVESVASTGGQIMPPVMGAGAFIMAEALAVPYRDVMYAAILPAMLYFAGVWFAVDLRARRRGLGSVPAEQIPSMRQTLRTRGHMALPILLLVGMLIAGYSALYCASFAILAAIPISWLHKETRLTPRALIQAFIEGARASLSVSVACIVVGIVIGVVTLTGLGTRMGYSVISLAGDQTWLALILTMFVCLILGMGLPTSAAYIVASTIAVPILGQLGIQPLPAHFFVFYFAILAGITPPVAITSFIAAGLAGASASLTSWIALRVALPGFIVPFLFVYHPELLIGADGTLWHSLWAAVTALLGVWCLTAAFEGYGFAPLKAGLRGALVLAAGLLLWPDWVTDVTAVAMLAVLLGPSFLRQRPDVTG